MKALLTAMSLGSALIVLSACAHHKDVRPGADGINRVVNTTEDPADGSRAALKQANNYCKEFDKHPVIVTEGNKYVGAMDEADYKQVKAVGRVAKTAGGAVWALGGKDVQGVGGAVGLGGVAADEYAGKGYTVEMTFKCQ
jgi:hypothetical protein